MAKASSPSPKVLLPAVIAQGPHAESIAAMLDDLRELAAAELGIPLDKIIVEIKLTEPQLVSLNAPVANAAPNDRGHLERNGRVASSMGKFVTKRQLRPRFWITLSLATITGLLCLITLILPDWIEAISGWDPDQHGGLVEWIVMGSLAWITATGYMLAWIEWRHSPVFVS
jgi:hypothetical protein